MFYFNLFTDNDERDAPKDPPASEPSPTPSQEPPSPPAEPNLPAHTEPGRRLPNDTESTPKPPIPTDA